MTRPKILTRQEAYTLLLRKGLQFQTIIRCIRELTPVQESAIEFYNEQDIEDWIASNSPPTPTHPTRKS